MAPKAAAKGKKGKKPLMAPKAAAKGKKGKKPHMSKDALEQFNGSKGHEAVIKEVESGEIRKVKLDDGSHIFLVNVRPQDKDCADYHFKCVHCWKSFTNLSYTSQHIKKCPHWVAKMAKDKPIPKPDASLYDLGDNDTDDELELGEEDDAEKDKDDDDDDNNEHGSDMEKSCSSFEEDKRIPPKRKRFRTRKYGS